MNTDISEGDGPCTIAFQILLRVQRLKLYLTAITNLAFGCLGTHLLHLFPIQQVAKTNHHQYAQERSWHQGNVQDALHSFDTLVFLETVGNDLTPNNLKLSEGSQQGQSFLNIVEQDPRV